MDTLFKINGIAVGPLVRGRSLSWESAYGIDPVSRLFELPDDVANLILQSNPQYAEDGHRDRRAGSLLIRTRERNSPAGQGVSIEIGDDKFVGLTALRPQKSQIPGYTIIEITDLRWRLRYTHVERSYNIRKRGSGRRIVNGKLVEAQGVDLQNQLGENIADYTYRRETLLEGEPWGAEELLSDLLTELVGSDNFEIKGDLKFMDTVDGFDLSTDGRTALASVLAYLPAARLYVSREGKLVVTSGFDNSALVGELKKAKAWEEGSWSISKNIYERPSKYRIYFDREVEFRFDSGRFTNSSQVVGKEPPELENVIENPFTELDLGNGKKAAKGELVEASLFFTAANNRNDKPLQAASSGWIAEYGMLRNRTGNMAAWSSTFRDANNRVPTAEWQGFVGNVARDWRTLYRLTPRWVDKVRGIFPHLTATVDQENATRAPALVYTQYITKLAYYVLPGQNVSAPKDYATGFQTDDWSTSLDGKPPSPFKVVVLDQDQGVFRIVPRTPPDGHIDRYQLGKVGSVEGLSMPKMAVADAQALWSSITLDSDFQLAVILTIFPAVPNSIERLHPVDVSIDRAALLLGVDSPGEGNAGVHEIKTDIRKAKFAWIDARYEDLRDLIYTGNATESVLSDCFANKVDLDAIAEAYAARELAIKLDVPIGDVVYPKRKIHPQGSLARVIHTVSSGEKAGGKMSTRLIMERQVPPANPLGFMPQSVRDKIRRIPTDD